MERKRTSDSFLSSSRALEDAFFLEQDRLLLARKAEMAKMAETKEALAAVSGIRNDDVLQALVKLNVRPETLAALSAVPLVEVVWADGHVDEEERQVVSNFAQAHGMTQGGVARELLERWLAQRPPASLLEAWQQYVEAICKQLSPDDRTRFKDELLHYVREAAQASGGFLGLGKVSAEEKAVIARLEASFCGA